MKAKHNLLLLPALFFIGSCATTLHTPMSELLMFQEQESIEDSVYYSGSSKGILNYGIDYYKESVVVNYAQNKSGGNIDYRHVPIKTMTVNFLLKKKEESRFAGSIAFGNPIGINFTINPFGQTYLTGGASYSKESPFLQYILQQRLLDGNTVGLSIGGSYHTKEIFVRKECTEIFERICTDTFGSKVVGLRSVFVYSRTGAVDTSQPIVYLVFSYNYDLLLETYYPRISVSIGMF